MASRGGGVSVASDRAGKMSETLDDPRKNLQLLI
jgi:hypothetical protein